MSIEKLRKAAIYLTADNRWWRLGTDADRLAIRVGPVEPYIIDLTARLYDGHFAPFDRCGIPMKNYGGRIGAVYNITRVCGYALCCFDRYLQTGEDIWRGRFSATADWLMEYGELDDLQGYVWRYTYADSGRSAGRISGMAQGQGISVYVRAYYLTGETRWLECATQTLQAFRLPMKHGGVLSQFSRIGCEWYEEAISDPPTHILNGHIYALVGIRDLAVYADVPEAKSLYVCGLESLVVGLPYYDCGFWSLYDCPEAGRRRYLASYSYHLMHCLLLRALARWHPEIPELDRFSRRWDDYRRNMWYRLRAASTMFVQKIRCVR